MPFDLTPEEIAHINSAFKQLTPPKILSQVSESRIPSLSDLMIRTKQKALIPFVPNSLQRRYAEYLFSKYISPLQPYPDYTLTPTGLSGVREIILKGRQFGLSTEILGFYFLDTITTPRTHTVVIAHDLESTTTLFETVQRFHENLPPRFRRQTKYANKRELYWSDLDSSFTVGTAGSKDYGRGRTINNVHMSEVAFWPDAQSIIGGLLQAVPKEGNIFIETTANGLGNWFEEEWNRAEDGHSIFNPRFFCWKDFEEYRITDPRDRFYIDPEKIISGRNTNSDTLTPEEKLLQSRFGLDLSQLAWRRMKIAELGKLFQQEYPLTPEEAFLVTGTPYFDREALSKLVPDPNPKSYSVASAYRNPASSHSSQKIDKQLSRLVPEELEVYEEPAANGVYVIGADTMEGPSSDDPDSVDFDSADVLRIFPHQAVQVAHLHGRWDTREYGLLLAELGFWYNTALLLVERNNHGHAVLQTLLHDSEMFYPVQGLNGGGGIYLHTEYDRTTRYESRKPGFPTTQRSKYLALDNLKTSIEENTLLISSSGTLKELLRFVKKPGGKAGGEGKSKDDRVMSLAIANYGVSLAPYVTVKSRTGGQRTVFSSAPIRGRNNSVSVSPHAPYSQRSYSPPGTINSRRR